MGRITVDYDEAMESVAYGMNGSTPARLPVCKEPLPLAEAAPILLTFGQRLRSRCRAQKGWTRDVSTRNIADAMRLAQQFHPDECWSGFFEDWSDADCDKVGAVRDRDAMCVTLE